MNATVLGDFDGYGKPYHAESRYTVKKREDLRALLPAGFSAKKILEVGCADGTNLIYFCEELGISKDSAVGVDLCKSPAVEDAQFRFYHQSAEQFVAESDERFDLILLSDVLEHIYNPWLLLLGIKRLLTQRGHLLVSVPNFQNVRYMGALATGDFLYTQTGLFDQTHIRFFTHKSLNTVLAQSGFSVVRTGYRPDRSLDQMRQSVLDALLEKPRVELAFSDLKFAVSRESVDQMFGQQLLVAGTLAA